MVRQAESFRISFLPVFLFFVTAYIIGLMFIYQIVRVYLLYPLMQEIPAGKWMVIFLVAMTGAVCGIYPLFLMIFQTTRVHVSKIGIEGENILFHTGYAKWDKIVSIKSNNAPFVRYIRIELKNQSPFTIPISLSDLEGFQDSIFHQAPPESAAYKFFYVYFND